MKAFTIGVGPYKELAELAAARMRVKTGLEIEVWDTLPQRVAHLHPSMAKLEIALRHYAGSEVFFFDADVICMKSWEPRSELLGADLAMSRDTSWQSGVVKEEADKFGIPRANYFNAGLWLADLRKEAVRDVLEAVIVNHLEPQTGSWLEQTGLNIELWKARHRVKMNVLPRGYNTMVRLEDGFRIESAAESLRQLHCVNAHMAGQCGTGNAEVLGCLTELLVELEAQEKG